MESRSRVIERLLDVWRKAVRRTAAAARGSHEETDARVAEGASRSAYHDALAKDEAADSAAAGEESTNTEVA